MTMLSVGDALADGLERFRNPELLVLLATAYLLQLTVMVGTQSQLALQREQLETEPTPLGLELTPEMLPLALDIPMAVSSFLWIVGMISLVTISMIALRVLSRNTSERGDTEAGDGTEFGEAAEAGGANTDSGARATPGAHASTGSSVGTNAGAGAQLDGLGMLTLRGIGASLFLLALISVGLVLFVLPGLFVATVFAFTLPYVATSRTGVIEGMKRSYDLTRGARFRVFGVLLTIAVGFFAFSFAGGLAALLLESQPVAAELANTAFATLAWLFVLAVLASAFDQLEGIREEEAEKWAGIDDELLP